MRKLFITICIAGVTLAGFSQNTFTGGNKVVNVTLGLGNSLYAGDADFKLMPISASFEMNVKDHLFNDKSSLGVGGYFGMTMATYSFESGGYKSTYHYGNYILGARAALHYQLVKKMDTYAGVMLGYNIATASYTHNFPSSIPVSEPESYGGFAYAGFIGARYYFTSKIGAVAELGYGVAYFNLGLTFKL